MRSKKSLPLRRKALLGEKRVSRWINGGCVRVPWPAFTIRFLHSVQKTPVWENLQVEQDGTLTLLSTRYQSFGVGLPFLESEGDFHEEGDYFVFDHMNRHFPQLTLRTGVGTRLTLSVAGREYRLYEAYPPGTRVDIVVLPLWRLAFWRPQGR